MADIQNNINNVNVELSVVLGSTKKSIKDILQMGEGTIVVLDKNYEEPVTIFVNNLPFAEGTVVSCDNDYGVKVTKIFTEDERKLI